MGFDSSFHLQSRLISQETDSLKELERDLSQALKQKKKVYLYVEDSPLGARVKVLKGGMLPRWIWNIVGAIATFIGFEGYRSQTISATLSQMLTDPRNKKMLQRIGDLCGSFLQSRYMGNGTVRSQDKRIQELNAAFQAVVKESVIAEVRSLKKKMGQYIGDNHPGVHHVGITKISRQIFAQLAELIKPEGDLLQQLPRLAQVHQEAEALFKMYETCSVVKKAQDALEKVIERSPKLKNDPLMRGVALHLFNAFSKLQSKENLLEQLPAIDRLQSLVKAFYKVIHGDSTTESYKAAQKELYDTQCSVLITQMSEFIAKHPHLSQDDEPHLLSLLEDLEKITFDDALCAELKKMKLKFVFSLKLTDEPPNTQLRQFKKDVNRLYKIEL